MELEDKLPVFDWSMYGALVRNARMRLGYRRAEDFSKSIYRRTRGVVSRDTLYKIEQGRQKPDAEQFMALNMALSGNPFYPGITEKCMSPEWYGIMTNGSQHIPNDWKVENLEDEGLAPEQIQGGAELSDAVEDVEWLYTDHRTYHDEY